MRRILLLLLLFAQLAAFGRTYRFDSLAVYLPRIEMYKQARATRLDSLRRMSHSPRRSQHSMNAARKLAMLYLISDRDSAYYAERLAYEISETLGMDSLSRLLRMRSISLMPGAGLVHEGVDEFESIDIAGYDTVALSEYYSMKAFMNMLAAHYYPPGDYQRQRYVDAAEAIDTMISLGYGTHPGIEYLHAERSHISGDFAVAAARFSEILDSVEAYPYLFNHACEVLAQYYADNPANAPKYHEILERRAVNSIVHGVPDAQAMAKIAAILFENGDKNFAYELFSCALQNSSMKTINAGEPELSQYMAVYTGAGKIRQRRLQTLLTAILTLCAALAGASAFYFLRCRKLSGRLSGAEDERLAERQHTDEAARSMLALALAAWNRHRDFVLLAERKLAASQAKDLYAMISGGKVSQADAESFLSAFDKTFVSVYPDFFDNMNTLFREEARMNVDPAQPLTPEQRIAALLRLGINDAPQLASMLRLSLNTVYTYRNRLKGRALKRDTFEEDLLRIY